MIQRPNNSKRVQLLAAVLLLMVFLAGSLAGAATRDGGQSLATSQRISVSSGQDLSALDLSQGQRTSLDEILARHQPAADSIVSVAMNDLRALMELVDAEVRTLLSPDQIEALDAMRSAGPRIRAVRRTLGPDGEVIDADTVR